MIIQFPISPDAAARLEFAQALAGSERMRRFFHHITEGLKEAQAECKLAVTQTTAAAVIQMPMAAFGFGIAENPRSTANEIYSLSNGNSITSKTNVNDSASQTSKTLLMPRDTEAPVTNTPGRITNS